LAVREWLTRTFGAKASIVPLAPDQIPDRGLEKSYDDRDFLSTYADDAWPYILANKGGEQASQAPLQVGRLNRDGEFEPVGPDHPVQHLFDNPNPTMDGGEFIHLLWVYMELAGHSPIEFVRPQALPNGIIGAPGRRGTRQRDGFELWLVNPGPWRIVAKPDGSVRGYLWVRTSETDVRWSPEQMTYLRWPNPNDRWYGQGRITALRQEVMAEEYAAIRDKKFEKNLGVPPGILSSEMPLGQPQAEELQRRWQLATGGYNNAGKIAVLGSKTTYQAITPNSREAEWLNQRRFRIEALAAAFGIPMPLILMQDAKFANAQEARAEFWEGTLQPRLNRIARMVTHRLLPLITSEPLVARFDYDKIEALGENDLEAAQTATAWANTGGVTVDEVRTRLGLGPHKDKSVGERLLIPSTIALTDATTLAEKDQMAADAQAASIEAQRNPPPVPAKAMKAEPIDDARERLLSPLRDQYQRDLSQFFTAQRNALNTAIPKALPQDEADRMLERILVILNDARWITRLRRISEGPITTSITLGATEAAGTLGITASFSIPASQEAVALLTTHLDALGVTIANTTNADVRRVLTDILREGVTNSEIRTALDGLFTDYQAWRLDRIARTELGAAYNLGAIGQYRAAGVTQVRVYDGDDVICAEWDGRVVSLEEAEGSPLGHPNCRRTWSPITEGL